MAKRINLENFTRGEGFPREIEGVMVRSEAEMQEAIDFVVDSITSIFRRYYQQGLDIEIAGDETFIEECGDEEQYDSEWDHYYCEECGETMYETGEIFEHAMSHVHGNAENRAQRMAQRAQIIGDAA